MSLGRFPWVLTLFAAIAFVVLVTLGMWQMRRLEWKEDLLARRAALAEAPAIPLEEALARTTDPAGLDLTRVWADCPGLDRAPYQQVYTLVQGRVAYRLVSACRLPEGGPFDAVLVDRGYVGEEVSARPVEEIDDYPVRVTGVLTTPASAGGRVIGQVELVADPAASATTGPQRQIWMIRNLPGIAEALGSRRPAPVFLSAETSSNPDWLALKPGLPPTSAISNNHLQYALTWFGLAAVLACIYGAMLIRRLRTQ